MQMDRSPGHLTVSGVAIGPLFGLVVGAWLGYASLGLVVGLGLGTVVGFGLEMALARRRRRNTGQDKT